LLPVEGSAIDNALGILIGSIEVTVRGEIPMPLDGELAVFAANREAELLTVPVHGQIVPEVQLSPGALVLPRKSGAGLTYEGNCYCRDTRGEPFDLEPETVPPGLTVRVESPTISSSVRVIRVTMSATQRATADGQPLRVRFRAKVGQRVVPVELPVTYLAGG
jgi:hypothetical protein